MKKLISLLIFAALLSAPSPAWAAEEPGAEYDGYIVCLREETVMLYASLPDGIEPVVPEAGLYRAETLADAAYFPPDCLRYIEPNYTVTLFSEEDQAEGTAWNLEMLGADAAWAAGLDGSGVRVGVVDSGLYAEHTALAGARIVPGWNYADGSADTSDDVGHGTFVTSIITSAAPGAEAVPLKCFTSRNSTVAHIAAAIRGGVDDYGCGVLNLSFGMDNDTQTLRETVEYAASKGAVMLAAVGNEGTAALKYPAAYSEVIGVGMVDQEKTVARGSQRNESVFVTAPGSGVTGPGIKGPDYYYTSGGTSFACPHVSAAAALMKQAVPGLSAEGFMAALRDGAEDLGEPGYDVDYGYGLLSVPAMLAALPLEPIPAEDGLRLHVVRAGLDNSTQFWAAGYDGIGRMLECRLLETAAVRGVLAGCGILPCVDGITRVQLFYLKEGTLEPISGSGDRVWDAG